MTTEPYARLFLDSRCADDDIRDLADHLAEDLACAVWVRVGMRHAIQIDAPFDRVQRWMDDEQFDRREYTLARTF